MAFDPRIARICYKCEHSFVDDAGLSVMGAATPVVQGLVAGIKARGVPEIDLAVGLGPVHGQSHAQALHEFAVLGGHTPRWMGLQQLAHRQGLAVDGHAACASDSPRKRSTSVRRASVSWRPRSISERT